MLRKSTDSVYQRMLPYFDPEEAAEGYATSGEYYEWYFTYAAHVRPRRILEIGTRRGYSAIAMLLGHPRTRELALIDDGSYGHPVAGAVANVHRLRPRLCIEAHALDTQSARALPVKGLFELIHVDGDHTYRGALHDLSLVLPHLAPRGIIVVDDVDHISRCMRAVIAFHASHRDLHFHYVPTFRGHVLLARSAATLGEGGITPPAPRRRRPPSDATRLAARDAVSIGNVTLFGLGATPAVRTAAEPVRDRKRARPVAPVRQRTAKGPSSDAHRGRKPRK